MAALTTAAADNITQFGIACLLLYLCAGRVLCDRNFLSISLLLFFSILIGRLSSTLNRVRTSQITERASAPLFDHIHLVLDGCW
jgi:hypothetical protein